MRIAFVWPPAMNPIETIPIVFGYLYDVIKHQGHTVKLFNLPIEGWTEDDPRFLAEIEAFQPDLVGISAWSMAFPSVTKTISAVRPKLPKAIYVVGGNYPSLQPEATWNTGLFDYVVMGEAERTFPEMLRLIEAGDLEALKKLKGMYFKESDGRVIRNRNVYYDDLDALGNIDYEFIDLNRCIERGYQSTVVGEKRKAPIIATRGCPYACHFCTVPAMNGTAPRHFSVDYLIRQMRLLYDRFAVRHLNFMDDNPTMSMDFFKDLMRAVIDLKKRGELKGLVLENYRGSRLEHLDPEMCRLMKEAGFKHVVIAPESGNERVRNLMNKNMSTEDIRNAAKMIKAAGLGLQGFFIVGYPSETPEERQDTYRFIEELGFDAFKLHKFVALPGTASFQKLVRDKKIEQVYTPSGRLLGNPVPNYNGDDPKILDREIFLAYAKFYLRHPTKFRHVLEMASSHMIWRSFTSLTEGTLATFIAELNGEEPPPPPDEGNNTIWAAARGAEVMPGDTQFVKLTPKQAKDEAKKAQCGN